MRDAANDCSLPADHPRWLHALSVYREWQAAPEPKPGGIRLYVVCKVLYAIEAQSQQLLIGAGKYREAAAAQADSLQATEAQRSVTTRRERPAPKPDPFAGRVVRGGHL